MTNDQSLRYITLNGRPHPLDHPLTVVALLESLGLAGQPVVVELNRCAVRPGEHATARVEPGATVEIVTLTAGG